MTEQTAEQHLRDRLKLMDKRYVRDYPKWTIADTVAVSIMLREVVNLRIQLLTKQTETEEV